MSNRLSYLLAKAMKKEFNFLRASDDDWENAGRHLVSLIGLRFVTLQTVDGVVECYVLPEEREQMFPFIYIAAPFGEQAKMREVASRLIEEGYPVTSRWVTSDQDEFEELSHEELAEIAIDDMNDVVKSDLVLSFTVADRTLENSRGGRHVEFGMALAFNKRTVIIGPREHVFHHLYTVEQYDTLDDFIKADRKYREEN